MLFYTGDGIFIWLYFPFSYLVWGEKSLYMEVCVSNHFHCLGVNFFSYSSQSLE